VSDDGKQRIRSYAETVKMYKEAKESELERRRRHCKAKVVGTRNRRMRPNGPETTSNGTKSKRGTKP